MHCYKRGGKGPINSALSDIKKIVGLAIRPNYYYYLKLEKKIFIFVI